MVVDHATSCIRLFTGEPSLKHLSKLLPAITHITWSQNGGIRLGCRKYNCHVGHVRLPFAKGIIVVKWALEVC